jgi:hypothetical protein
MAGATKAHCTTPSRHPSCHPLAAPLVPSLRSAPSQRPSCHPSQRPLAAPLVPPLAAASASTVTLRISPLRLVDVLKILDTSTKRRSRCERGRAGRVCGGRRAVAEDARSDLGNACTRRTYSRSCGYPSLSAPRARFGRGRPRAGLRPSTDGGGHPQPLPAVARSRLQRLFNTC